MNYKYEISEDNALVIYELHPEWVEFKVTDSYPIRVLESYPDGTEWTEQEATDWAELFILSLVDENAPYPPNGPGEEPQPKPSKREKVLWAMELRSRG